MEKNITWGDVKHTQRRFSVGISPNPFYDKRYRYGHRANNTIKIGQRVTLTERHILVDGVIKTTNRYFTFPSDGTKNIPEFIDTDTGKAPNPIFADLMKWTEEFRDISSILTRNDVTSFSAEYIIEILMNAKLFTLDQLDKALDDYNKQNDIDND